MVNYIKYIAKYLIYFLRFFNFCYICLFNLFAFCIYLFDWTVSLSASCAENKQGIPFMSPLLMHERATAAYLFPTGFLFSESLWLFCENLFIFKGSDWAACLPPVSVPVSVSVFVPLCLSLSTSSSISFFLSFTCHSATGRTSCSNPQTWPANCVNDAADLRPLAALLQGIQCDKCNAMCGQQFYEYFYSARVRERERKRELCFILSVFAAICLLFFM